MITIELKQNYASDELHELRKRLTDLTPVMRRIAAVMADQTANNFAHESGPLGKWPAIKPPKNKRRTSPKILRDTGRLSSSITTRHDRRSATIGTNVIYAAIHQLGGDIAMASRSQRLYFLQNKHGEIGRQFVSKKRSNFSQWATIGAYKIHMPARPYLPFANGQLQPELLTAIASELRSYLSGLHSV